MYKLLIVLAIQFCLPWIAIAIHKSIPWNWAGNLDGPVAVIATVSAGNMLGLMRTRWLWMLATCALLFAYWGIWLELRLSEYQASIALPFDHFEFRWYYLKILLQLLGVNFVLGLMLSKYLLLVRISKKENVTQQQRWQFQIRDLLYLTMLCAGLVLTAVYRFQPTDAFDNFLGLLVQSDAITMITAVATFYQLLWQRLNWRWVALGLFYISVFLLCIYDDPQKIYATQQEQQIKNFCVFLIAIISMLLYRAAGIRIVWRRMHPRYVKGSSMHLTTANHGARWHSRGPMLIILPFICLAAFAR